MGNSIQGRFSLFSTNRFCPSGKDLRMASGNHGNNSTLRDRETDSVSERERESLTQHLCLSVLAVHQAPSCEAVHLQPCHHQTSPESVVTTLKYLCDYTSLRKHSRKKRKTFGSSILSLKIHLLPPTVQCPHLDYNYHSK